MRDDVVEWTLGSATLRLEVSSATDVGAVRRVNEDSMLVLPPVFLVADGMGGHSFGDRASRIAVDVFADGLAGGEPATVDQVIDLIASANSSVVGLSAGQQDVVSGTTLTGLALTRSGDRHVWIAFNLGDSRLYRLVAGELQQLSTDHSVVQELVDSGLITAAQARTHPERNIVTRALGASPDAVPDVWPIPLAPRQTFVLCSDGLTKELDDARIARIVADGAAGGRSVAEKLVDEAVAAGGRDNVTVVVLECELIGAASDPDEETLDRAPAAAFEDTIPRI